VTDTELLLLKSSIDKRVQIETSDGERMIAKVISVFDEESDGDIFYELVSTSQPDLYARKERVGGYSLLLKDIVSVRPAE
jgi:hypothetical protein